MYIVNRKNINNKIDCSLENIYFLLFDKSQKVTGKGLYTKYNLSLNTFK